MDEYVSDIGKLAIFLAAHGAIYVNRAIIKPAINNDRYSNVSLAAEHIVSYATTPLAVEVMYKYLGYPDAAPYAALVINLTRAIFGDSVRFWQKPGDKTYRRPQWDQFLEDIVGTAAFFTIIR